MFARWREKPKAQQEVPVQPVQTTVQVHWPLSSPPDTPKRCALVLYGLPKFFAARSFPSLQARVISRLPMPVDVFVHTYDLHETTNSRNGEVACPLDPSEVMVAKPKRVETTSQDIADKEFQPHFSELKRYGDAWFNHFVSLRNVLRQYNSLQQVRARRAPRAASARARRRAPTERAMPPMGRPAPPCATGVRARGGGAEALGRAVRHRVLLAHGRALPRRPALRGGRRPRQPHPRHPVRTQLP